MIRDRSSRSFVAFADSRHRHESVLAAAKMRA